MDLVNRLHRLSQDLIPSGDLLLLSSFGPLVLNLLHLGLSCCQPLSLDAALFIDLSYPTLLVLTPLLTNPLLGVVRLLLPQGVGCFLEFFDNSFAFFFVGLESS